MAVTINGSTGIEYDDNVQHVLGTGDDLKVYHSGSHSYLQHTTGHPLWIQNITGQAVNISHTDGTDLSAKFNIGGSAELYYDNTKKLQTKSWGVEFLEDWQCLDSKKGVWGTGDDLQIYHDGSNSYIKNAGGDLVVYTVGTENVTIKTNSEKAIDCIPDSGVEIYHNNVLKARTVSDGFEIQSNVEGGEALCTFVADQADDNNDYWAAGAGDGKFTIKTYASSSWTERFRLEDGSARFLAPDGGMRYFFGEMGNSASAELSLYDSSDAQKVKISADSSQTSFFNSGGNVYIGCTQVPDSSNTGAGFDMSNHAELVFGINGTGNATRVRFKNDNGEVGAIRTNGTATVYHTSSDYRRKENAVSISDGITRLKNLKPYRFNFKADASTILDGFFAHEVSSVVPIAVGGTKDEVDSNGDPVYQGIDHSMLVPLLTAALQEAITKIETLETKVAALEAA